MPKLRIGYTPFENKENAYTKRTIEILSHLGSVSKTPTLRDFLRNPFRHKPGSYEFTISNWTENSIINPKGNLSAIGTLKFILNIALMKIISKKTIFVRHNNYPHNSSTRTAPRAERIIDIAEYFFDHVVTHSGHNESSKRIYIPHPLYKFPDSAQKGRINPGNYFLIFGRILPYKKIERIIEAIPPEISLIIAGSAPDKSYVEKLSSLAATKEIQLIPEFISDEKAMSLAKGSRGIVITHNDNDMIVSGTFFYAVSIGVPVYSVSTPFTEWAANTLKIPGLYVARNIHDLCSKLKYCTEQNHSQNIDNQKKIEQLFGDAVIEHKWSEILNSPSKNS